MCEYHRSCREKPFNADACKAAMYKCLQGLEDLNGLWREGLPEAEHKYQPFHVRPKGHEMHHLVEEKLPIWGSPSGFWCYRDEDFIGAVKVMAARSSHPFNLERRVLEKLQILAALGFSP
jgi:hypothetical protein